MVNVSLIDPTCTESYSLIFNMHLFTANAVASSANASNRHPDKKKQPHFQATSSSISLSENTFLPYQLAQWEDDIIYDAQLSSNKVTASARQNAAYAGWIPSQNFRTMSTFQVSHLIIICALRTFSKTEGFKQFPFLFIGRIQRKILRDPWF